MGRPAKALSGFNRTVGSNPTLSATQSRSALSVFVVIFFWWSFLFVPLARAACEPSYVVKRGESWWSIARAEGVALRTLLKVNSATSSTMLQPNEKICVPHRAPSSAIGISEAEVIGIIRSVWPDNLEQKAITIARRESKLKPRVIGIPNNCCYGLFQIYYKWHKKWLPSIGVDRAEQLLDPKTNAVAALEIYRRSGGWSPWED